MTIEAGLRGSVTEAKEFFQKWNVREYFQSEDGMFHIRVRVEKFPDNLSRIKTLKGLDKALREMK